MNDLNVEEIQKRLKYARKNAGFKSADSIATVLDLEVGTYNKYEYRGLITLRSLAKFCIATNTSIDWILHGNTKKAPQARSEEDKWLHGHMDYIKNLNASERAAYDDLIAVHKKHYKASK